MGGQGSGGWNLKYEYTTGDMCRLDVNRLRKQGCFERPSQSQLTWSMNGIVQLDLKARFEKGILHLRDATASGSPDSDNYRQPIEVITRTPAVGGQTKLFKCPCCYKARAHLYLHDPFFICRECAGLTYQSRRERNPLRAFRRWDKLSEKLGGIGMDQWYCAKRPKGMHQTTFERLKQEIHEVESYIDREAWRSFRR